MTGIDIAAHLAPEVREAVIASAIDALDAGWTPLFLRDIGAPCYSCGEVARVVSKDDDRWTMTILDHLPTCLHVMAEDRRADRDRWARRTP